MIKNKEIIDKLTTIMITSLLELQNLANPKLHKDFDFLSTVPIFLTDVIATFSDLIDIHYPGAALHIYAELGEAIKLGGFRAIKKIKPKDGSVNYSVPTVDLNDLTTAANQLGQELLMVLSKGINNLPMPLCNSKEISLRVVEALITNLLHNKFYSDGTHQILDSLCEHVHMSLQDLEPNIKKFPAKDTKR